MKRQDIRKADEIDRKINKLSESASIIKDEENEVLLIYKYEPLVSYVGRDRQQELFSIDKKTREFLYKHIEDEIKDLENQLKEMGVEI
jgi:hypothetical protein